jgi:hypothetical protein
MWLAVFMRIRGGISGMGYGFFLRKYLRELYSLGKGVSIAP